MEIILSGLAEAILEIIIGDLAKRPGLETIRERLRGAPPEKVALENALSRAYLIFAKDYPELTSSLFDKRFLKRTLIENELAKLLTPSKTPDPSLIANEWKQHLKKNFNPQFNLIPPIEFFLITLEEEIKASAILKPFIDSRAFDQLYSIATHEQEQVQLQKEIVKLLEEIKNNVARAEEIKGGTVVSVVSSKSVNLPQFKIESSDQEKIDYWLSQDKNSKEFNKENLNNHFRVANILYASSGLPEDLINKKAAEQLVKQVGFLQDILIEQRETKYDLILEWGFEAAKAVQDWSNLFFLTFAKAAYHIDRQESEGFKWLDRMEKCIPKLSKVFDPEKIGYSIDSAMLEFEILTQLYRAKLTPNIDEAQVFVGKIENKLDSDLFWKLPPDERQDILNLKDDHYLKKFDIEADTSSELLNNKRYEQALSQYDSVLETVYNISPGNRRNLISRALLMKSDAYRFRDREGDFDLFQQTLKEAIDEANVSEDDYDQVLALILMYWGIGNHNTGRPKAGSTISERFKTNIKWDYKSRAKFTIQKLNFSLEHAIKSNSEALFGNIHFFLALAYYDLENKNEALRNVHIAIKQFEKNNSFEVLRDARDLERRIKKLNTFWGF